MLVCALPLLLHTRPRVHRAPGIPHALWFEGGRFMASLEQKSMLRDREPVPQRQPVFRRHRALQYLNVIARSPCDEAIHSWFLTCCAMDCFAALAMTLLGLCIAREHEHSDVITRESVWPGQITDG